MKKVAEPVGKKNGQDIWRNVGKDIHIANKHVKKNSPSLVLM